MIPISTSRHSLGRFALAALACVALLTGVPRIAQAADKGAPDTNLGAAPLTDTPFTDESTDDDSSMAHRHIHHHHHDQNNIVNIGHDSQLAASGTADSVVSILGSSTSAGVITDSIVSIVGNTHVTGPVADSAVAVLGNVYVDSAINGDVVAVLGGVELGPHAVVGGDVVSIGGAITRDPNSVLHGEEQSISIGAAFADFTWLRPWIQHCLLKGRVLAFAPGLGWAWTLALGSLALYALCALLFRPALERCVQTLQVYPLQSVVTALLCVLATPVLLILLCITVIGILAIPFLGLALLAAESFGKLVVLVWIGQRITRSVRSDVSLHPALYVLIGGVIVLAIYTVPVLSMIMYKLIGFIGFGVVVYTLLIALRSRRPALAAAAIAPEAAAAAASVGMAAASPAEAPATPAGGAEPPLTAAPGIAPSSAKPAIAAASYPRAGFWVRMGALLLDVILIGIIVGAILHLHSSHLHLLLLAVYGAVMWKLRGATIGGIVFHLQVVRLDGRPLDWATAIVRALGCFLSLFVVGLGFIWIAMDSEHQAWHDKIAGTVVVQMPKGVSLL
jgi:uncharacterized RDD family membrane protein YckC